VTASIAAALVALVAVWLYFKFPWPSWQDNAQAAAPDALSPRTSLASAESRQKFGVQDNAGVAMPAGPASPAQLMATRSPAFNASDDMVVLLLQRGNTALAEGDIIGARLLYERAAALGSAAAATSAGKTYDGEFLLQAGVLGIQADQSSAMAWFRKAAALGDPEARARLAHIESRNRP
jgi:TPR repeat protein